MMTENFSLVIRLWLRLDSGEGSQKRNRQVNNITEVNMKSQNLRVWVEG